MSRLLTPSEPAALDCALATRTRKPVRVGTRQLTVAQGIALWDAAASLARTKADQRLGRQLLATGTVLAATASLGACATLGGNVKGDFACRAPDGICAPTSTIDDAALAMISGDGASAQPAGPYSPSPDGSARTTLASAMPKRSGEKVLRIVFPAHVDGAGRFRETTAVHAVVERGAWMSANATVVAPPRVPAEDMPAARPVDTSSLTQRSLSDLAASAPEVRFPDPVAEADAEIASAEAAADKTPIARIAPVRGKGVADTAGSLPRVAYSVSAARVSAPTKPGLAASSSVPISAGAAAVTYLLPPKPVVSDGAIPANPMDAIRAQVAAQLGKTPTVAGPLSSSPLAIGTGPGPAAPKPVKPANAPSLFPVSAVNR